MTYRGISKLFDKLVLCIEGCTRAIDQMTERAWLVRGLNLRVFIRGEVRSMGAPPIGRSSLKRMALRAFRLERLRRKRLTYEALLADCEDDLTSCKFCAQNEFVAQTRYFFEKRIELIEEKRMLILEAMDLIKELERRLR